MTGSLSADHERDSRVAMLLIGGQPIAPPQPPAAAAPASTPQSSPPESDPDYDTDPLPPFGTGIELSEIRPGMALKHDFDWLAAATNLRLGVANSLLFQQATGGPGDRSAAGGDLDLLATWTALGAGTKDTGSLNLDAECRYQIGDLPPADLGGEIGTLLKTTNGFGERPLVIKELYWDQRLAEDHLRFRVGRVNPETLFGGHRLQSADSYFLNQAFSYSPTVAFPGPGLAGLVQIKPMPWLYIDGGITDANGKATVGNLEGFFDDHEFLEFAELAVAPVIPGLGSGRYRIAAWHIDARDDANRPNDRGVTVSFDQDLGPAVLGFTRYGHADGSVSGATDSFQLGAGIKGVLGDESMFGAAASWSSPKADGQRDERTLEVFQRFQITETTQFTLDAQVTFDPSRAPNDDIIGVFSARLRVSF